MNIFNPKALTFKFILIGILLCLGASVSSVSAQNYRDSIQLWFDASYSPEYNEVQVLPRVLNRASTELILYFSASTTLNNYPYQKQRGIFSVAPGDTAMIYLEINPLPLNENVKKVHLTISENEYILSSAIWSTTDYTPPPKTPILVSAQPPSEVVEEKKNTTEQPITTPETEKKLPPSTKNPKNQPQSNNSPAFLATDDFEISGLVFNETRTRFGSDFYRKLMEIWTPPTGVGMYWITVRELPAPGRTTVISVSLNNRELFQRNLIPRQGFIESLALQTANFLTSVLEEGNHDGSLSNEDLFGKGIE